MVLYKNSKRKVHNITGMNNFNFIKPVKAAMKRNNWEKHTLIFQIDKKVKTIFLKDAEK